MDITLSDVLYILLGTFFFVGVGLFAANRARRELAEVGRVTRPTFIASFIAYVGHGLTVLAAAYAGAIELPIPAALAWGSGLIVMAAGASFWILAHTQFRSFNMTWGLETQRLVTRGVYGVTRNPQVVGSVLFWIGAGLAGKSGAAILLALIELVAVNFWLPAEERALEARHGEAYARYRRRVPRWLGPVKRETDEAAAADSTAAAAK